MPVDSAAFPLTESPDEVPPPPPVSLGWSGSSGFLLGGLVILYMVMLFVQVSSLMDGAPSLARHSLHTNERADLDITEVARLPQDAFEPVPDQVSRGFTRAAQWFRLEMPADLTGEAVVVVQPSYLDDVRVYTPDPGVVTGWRLHQRGDRYPAPENFQSGPGFSVGVQPQAGGVLFVRVRTLNAHNIRVRVLPPAVADRENTALLVGAGLYCGAVLAMAAAAAVAALVYRDRHWAANAMYQLATLGGMFFFCGLGGAFLLPDAPLLADQLASWFGFIQYFICTLFYRQLFREYGAPGWLLNLQWPLLLLLPLQILLTIGGRFDLAAQASALVLPLAVLFGGLAVVFVRSDDVVLHNLLRINTFGTTMFFVLTYVTHLGLITPHFLQLYPGAFISLMTAVVLHLTLLRRRELLGREQEGTQRALALVRQQVEFERRRRQEDGRFLGMLMHEMRSPLSVIAVATGALERKLDTKEEGGSPGKSVERDLRRIGASVEQMRGVLRQVQAVSELEHHMGAHIQDEWPGFMLDRCEAGLLIGRLRDLLAEETRMDISELLPRAPGRLVRGSATLVEMMVRNLVDNALKYSPPESVVRCSCELRTGIFDVVGLTIRVTNRIGPVGPPDPTRLFDKYYRAPLAHQHSGSGLGLYWVRGTARLCGGDVEFEQQDDDVSFGLVLTFVGENG
jgi:signal transduction histidine kinase